MVVLSATASFKVGPRCFSILLASSASYTFKTKSLEICCLIVLSYELDFTFNFISWMFKIFPNYGTWRTSLFCSHPWEVMVEAAYRKYPNPHNPNVRTLDTLERRVDSVARRLFSHRLFSTMWSIPTVVMKVRHMTGVDTTNTFMKII